MAGWIGGFHVHAQAAAANAEGLLYCATAMAAFMPADDGRCLLRARRRVHGLLHSGSLDASYARHARQQLHIPFPQQS